MTDSSPFEKFSSFTDLCDFTFIVNGKAFRVHRIVFAAQSPIFAKIITNNQNEAVIEDIKEDIFEEVVKYMYSGNVHVTDKNERKLLIAGEKFELKELTAAVQLYRNCRMEPMKAKELEQLKIKFDEAKYLYKMTKDRYSTRNPFSQLPGRYY
ncbi:protein maternal effect lethal 26-like [Chironomus tepperi]|uniref:protein maternal effect lethal 26-like n=1 Tax=Chironomus tepperi TaxID=113505 RepID=UPI00391F01D2